METNEIQIKVTNIKGEDIAIDDVFLISIPSKTEGFTANDVMFAALIQKLKDIPIIEANRKLMASKYVSQHVISTYAYKSLGQHGELAPTCIELFEDVKNILFDENMTGHKMRFWKEVLTPIENYCNGIRNDPFVMILQSYCDSYSGSYITAFQDAVSVCIKLINKYLSKEIYSVDRLCKTFTSQNMHSIGCIGYTTPWKEVAYNYGVRYAVAKPRTGEGYIIAANDLIGEDFCDKETGENIIKTRFKKFIEDGRCCDIGDGKVWYIGEQSDSNTICKVLDEELQ